MVTQPSASTLAELAGRVTALLGALPVCRLAVEHSLDSARFALTVVVHTNDWRGAELLATRLGLDRLPDPGRLVRFVGECADLGCMVEAFSGAPTAVDGTALDDPPVLDQAAPVPVVAS